METVIVSVICIALLVLGGMTLSQGFLSSADSTTMGWEEMGARDGEIMRTEISPLTASQPSSNTTLEVELRNSGQTKLANFSRWDVIAQYEDDEGSYRIRWLSYTEGTPGNNTWTEGIYLDAQSETAEVFEPGILNPGEEMVIEAKLEPPVADGTTNLVVVSTPNGIPASISFPGYEP